MNDIRVGRFTSSEIVALIAYGSRDMTEDELTAHVRDNPKSKKKTIPHGFSEAGYTYIAETNMERRLGCRIDEESKAKPLIWGKHLEWFAHNKSGLDHRLISDQTIIHPDYDFWAGSPDTEALNTTGDYKCPMTRKSFCQLVDPLYDGLTGLEAINAIRNGYTDKRGLPHKAHKDGNKFYWQLVSNSILLGVEYAELKVYMPYEDDLPEIIRAAQNESPEYYWIGMAIPGDLPCIPNNGFYQDSNTIRFRVPDEDKLHLESRAVEASLLLI